MSHKNYALELLYKTETKRNGIFKSYKELWNTVKGNEVNRENQHAF